MWPEMWPKEPKTNRRFKRVGVSVTMFAPMLREGYGTPRDDGRTVACLEGVPSDAVLVHVYVDPVHTQPRVYYVFEHPDWPEVPEGEYPPELMVSYQLRDLEPVEA